MSVSDHSGASHSHSHASASRNRLALALGVTATVMALEVVGSYLSGSLALLADAGHMLVDSMGLIVALIAAQLMTKPPSRRRTWGFARAEVLSAGLQAGILIGLSLFIAYEAIQRLFEPSLVIVGPMVLMGAVGLLGNLISMLILAGNRNDSLNMKAAFLEVASDALGSVAVLVAALVLWLTGWPYADSVASLAIAVLIGFRAVFVLRQSVRILMESVPDGLDVDEVRRRLLANPDVEAVHDLHASTIGTGINTLTAHVIVSDDCVRDGQTVEVLHQLQNSLRDLPIDVNHVTIQIDSRKHAGHETLVH